jgi:hypothetical protein
MAHQPDPPPLSSHADLDLTRLCDEAGFIYHDGWFIRRIRQTDYDLLRRHPQPPRPYPYVRRLRANARSFAGLVWLFTFAVILWGVLVRDLYAIALGLLQVVMMMTFVFRTTRALRKGRLLLGTTQKSMGHATLITSSMDRMEIALHPAEPWPTVEIEVPPAPSRYLLQTGKRYEVLLLALDRPDHVQLLGFRPHDRGDGDEDAGETTGSDPS